MVCAISLFAVAAPHPHLRMNPLDMGVQVAPLGEGRWAEHAQVRLLSGVSRHVGLQHHLLVESLPAMAAFKGPLPWRKIKFVKPLTELFLTHLYILLLFAPSFSCSGDKTSVSLFCLPE